MALHKLVVDDFYDASFSLLAIHCRLEDYRLAYLLNKHLGLNLVRKPQDLDYNYFAASFSIYEWENTKFDTVWNLVSNVCKKEEAALQSSGSLFQNPTTIRRTVNLLPELKTVDYLIKVSNEHRHFNEKLILNKIQSIPQVITTYSVDIDQIKSKDHLIFD
ncbi:IPExxxVDY family protein [Psychroserpens sp. SPM9]|uniref:IPExxxVDY family protein n=1 Tax=Psychroserpens sp. SPM9 TaxID=2975598 RepID=UPI0021A6E97D|nr:IPExxxVDY family protein [Psychroserpens sp. SPM9]MDG5490954.1 IPExxxVDY family protein [Psychroserpens sp. SPM9]